MIEIDGESGREMRISRTVDLLEVGDETKRISDRLGDARDAIVITGDCDALTLMTARKKKRKNFHLGIVLQLTTIAITVTRRRRRSILWIMRMLR